MAFFKDFTANLRDKWLHYYQANRDWLLLQMQLSSVKTPDGGRRPPSSLILGVINALDPEASQLMLPFSTLNPDPEKLVEVLGLNFDPDIALGSPPPVGQTPVQAAPSYQQPPVQSAPGYYPPPEVQVPTDSQTAPEIVSPPPEKSPSNLGGMAAAAVGTAAAIGGGMAIADAWNDTEAVSDMDMDTALDSDEPLDFDMGDDEEINLDMGSDEDLGLDDEMDEDLESDEDLGMEMDMDLDSDT
ncbi:MAG: DUF5331 domain-containing protein, partial [Limnoraphis robusta]